MATLPNFILIGAPKAGTTSVYHYLKQHPEIYMSPQKEPRHFSYQAGVTRFDGPGDEAVEKIVIKSWSHYLSLFSETKDEKGIGEASVDYLSSPIAPKQLYQKLPHVKLIAILRDPIERAYSNFQHVVRQGREPYLDFTEALAQEEARIQAGWIYFWHYLDTGRYAKHLSRYFEFFPHEQIKIILFEDLVKNKHDVMKEIFSFIGVDPDFKVSMRKKHNAARAPASKSLKHLMYYPHGLRTIIQRTLPERVRRKLFAVVESVLANPHPQIPWETRQQLLPLFYDDNLKLQQLIKRDLSLWMH